MKQFLTAVVIFTTLFVFQASAKTWIVDQNGLGDYNTIMAAINVAKPGDVVKVHPGIYQEKVVIAKEIIVEGSGAESTMISSGSQDYAVDISSGQIKWFAITSLGNCVYGKKGKISNCIIKDGGGDGIVAYRGVEIFNCFITNNNSIGIHLMENYVTIQNCIITYNKYLGIAPFDNDFKYQLSFSLVYNNNRNYIPANLYKYGIELVNCIDQVDPQFQPGSYQISAGSPCRDAGNPAYQDPDGTRADMGYYGGPDAPTFPVLRNSLIKLNEDGTIQLEAIGISPY